MPEPTSTAAPIEMDKLVSLCKRRGFLFQSSEIYGGLNGFWDYGPLGVELKRNIKEAWWRDMVTGHDDIATPPGAPRPYEMVGLDCTIIMHPQVWKCSGHYDLFHDFMVDCRQSKKRYRYDQVPGRLVEAKGQKLFVPRANLPAPEEDEFYIVDLLGCRAESIDGQVLGDIVAVWNFGAGDIIEYRPPNGGPNVRVTFTKETAPLVDLPGKRVVLDPPAPEPLGK